MLRVPCSCGKSLKVDDKLAGKKIRCPACSTVLLVKPAQSDEPQGRPKALAKNGEIGKVPANKSKARASSEVEARRQKRSDNAGRQAPWLLIGGGVGALLLLVIVAVGGWFIFLRGDNKPQPVAVTAVKSPAKEQHENLAVKVESVAVKLFVPHKKGDRREVKVIKEARVISDQSNPGGGGAMDVKSSLQGIVKTLEVNDLGEETKVQITLAQFESLQGQQASVAFPRGTILLGSRSGEQFTWTSSNADLAPAMNQLFTELLSDRYGDVLESEADSLLGTDRPQLAGGTWKVNSQGLSQRLKDRAKLLSGPAKDLEFTKVAGTGKLVKIFTSEDLEYLAVDIAIDTAINTPATSANAHLEFNLHVPRDAATGPVRKVSKVRADVTVEMPLGGSDSPVVKPKVKTNINQTITEEIKYLDSTPIEDGPAPTVIPKANAPVALRLKNVNAAWVAGQTAVNLSADYWIAGDTKPKPDADYILYVKFADGDGGKKSYRVQTLSGAALSAEKKFANSSVAVSMPPKSMGSVCDVVLVEKAAGNPQEVVIDSQENVFVSGTPPAPTPATVAVDLSNAKVERLPKNKARFTVDYKFTSGQADAQKTYRLLANMFAGKTAQPQARPFEGKGSQLDTQGTLTYEIPYDVAATTKFEFYLTEAAGKNSKAKVVSNKLPGKVTTTTDPASANVRFQITQPLAAKINGPNRKVPAQSFQLQFQWKLVAGQLNPEATYTCVVSMAGNAVPLPQATQLTASGIYSQVLPYSGQNAFSIFIVESLPNQQPRPVSNVQNVRVK